jgi:hypothetical protein
MIGWWEVGCFERRRSLYCTGGPRRIVGGRRGHSPEAAPPFRLAQSDRRPEARRSYLPHRHRTRARPDPHRGEAGATRRHARADVGGRATDGLREGQQPDQSGGSSDLAEVSANLAGRSTSTVSNGESPASGCRGRASNAWRTANCPSKVRASYDRIMYRCSGVIRIPLPRERRQPKRTNKGHDSRGWDEGWGRRAQPRRT